MQYHEVLSLNKYSEIAGRTLLIIMYYIFLFSVLFFLLLIGGIEANICIEQTEYYQYYFLMEIPLLWLGYKSSQVYPYIHLGQQKPVLFLASKWKSFWPLIIGVCYLVNIFLQHCLDSIPLNGDLLASSLTENDAICWNGWSMFDLYHVWAWIDGADTFVTIKGWTCTQFPQCSL